ncbi:MAG: hypothetical protein IKP95_00390 [Ruminococcus sp.]|nr:hypothetical protein [Ruminococcus sp.]
MKISFLCLAVSVMALTSCSGSDSTKNPDVDLTAVEARQAFKGAEELMGQDYGSFTMPAAFDIPQLSEVYEISYNTEFPDYDKQKLSDLFTKFGGELFDKSQLSEDGTGGYYFGSDKLNCSYLTGMLDMSFVNEQPDPETQAEQPEMKLLGHYSVGSQFDETVTLNGIDTSVGQLAGFLDAELNQLLVGFTEPYELRAQVIEAYNTSNVFANCAYTLEGIPLQNWRSASRRLIEGKGVEYFDCFNVNAELQSTDKISLVYSWGGPPNILEKKKLESIIPLKRAVGILQSTLDPADLYNFKDVQLMYCGTVVNPRTSDIVNDAEVDSQQQAAFRAETKTLRPMWCFFVDFDSDNYNEQVIRVNAVTGEVILDL